MNLEEERTGMIANAGTFAGEMRDPNWSEIDMNALAAVSCPVLLTIGDQSPPIFAAVVSRLANAIDHAQVTTIPGAGHSPHQSAPAEWAAIVSEFAGASG